MKKPIALGPKGIRSKKITDNDEDNDSRSKYILQLDLLMPSDNVQAISWNPIF